MKRVTGIGGIFFKAKDPVALRAWYQRHLGIDVQPWGGAASIVAGSNDNHSNNRKSFRITLLPPKAVEGMD